MIHSLFSVCSSHIRKVLHVEFIESNLIKRADWILETYMPEVHIELILQAHYINIETNAGCIFEQLAPIPRHDTSEIFTGTEQIFSGGEKRGCHFL